MTDPTTKDLFCRVLTCDRPRDVGEYCAAHQPADPTTKAEPIGYVLTDERGEEVAVSMQELRKAGLVPVEQLAEANAKLEAAELRKRSAELGLEEFQRSAAVVEERNADLAEKLESAQGLAREWEQLRNDAHRQYRATADKLEAAERELAHCREAAELLRREINFNPEGTDWRFELERDKANWNRRDQAKTAEPEATAVVEPWVPKVGDRVRTIADAFNPGREGTVVTTRYCVRFDPSSDGQSISVSYGASALESVTGLSPAVTRAAEAVEAQDPMLRVVTFGELIAAVKQQSGPSSATGWAMRELAESLQRVAKGGGK